VYKRQVESTHILPPVWFSPDKHSIAHSKTICRPKIDD